MKKRKKEENVIVPNDEFYIVKNNKKIMLDRQGKIKQDINYTLVPKKNTETKKSTVIWLSVSLGLFLILGVLFMVFAYDIDVKKAIFEFCDNYLFIGAITLFVFLVFKSKK